ncbi:MAG: hypothetical protein IIZ18_00165 [Ruminococcus sp.]|nr:hypothetical protein [Ruminococcus sp.]
MKKYLALLAACVLVSASAGCSSGNSSSGDSSQTATDAAQTTSSGEDATAQTTAAEETSAASTTAGSAQTTTAVSSSQTAASSTSGVSGTETTAVTTTAGNGEKAEFQYNSDGAVEFSGDPADQNQDTLIAAAQAVYDAACQQQYRFTVGSPYTLDHETYIENDMGWQFYLVTDEGINSMADVAADYDKIFSSRYNSAIEEVFMESDGKVYCLDGQRGANIFYSYSQVVSVDKITPDEIFFTVTSYYDPTDINGEEPFTNDAQFSVVIEDGVWKAGEFLLPY